MTRAPSCLRYRRLRHAGFVARVAGRLSLPILLVMCVSAQTANPPREVIQNGYVVHQSVELGGHISKQYGSEPMYDTLVNLQSGPRILNQTLEMHAVQGSNHLVFDRLSTASAGYGGDPINFTTFRMSKGRIYDFRGVFRRNRQYFDYNLFANPLIPSGLISNGYTLPQALSTPHLFNTVRRMTDINLTLFPLSKVSVRAGYFQSINQGPTYSSVKYGTEGLLLQNWRNSSDNWLAAVDWKPFSKTMLTYQQYVMHYKGDTNWQLAGLNLQLSNRQPVSLGFDNVSVPSCSGGPAISSSTTTPPTANPTCDGFLQYHRYSPVRTLLPTEEFRFQSSDITHIQMNGRVRYTGGNMTMPNYDDYFNGLQNRGSLRVANITGNSKAERINVSADFGVVWQASDKISISEQYDFWHFRQPGNNNLVEIDQGGTSMLVAPGPPKTPLITSAQNFLGQKTQTNFVSATWEASAKTSVTLGYRYRSRLIDVRSPGAPYTVDIHENGGMLGVALRPAERWRVNGSVEISYANRTYTQIYPRALQHYQIHASYKPRTWATISGTFNDLERRNNVFLVNHLDHNRSFTITSSLTPSEHYGLDISYGYLDVFSRTTLCYAATPPPSGAIGVPPATGCGSNIYLGNGYYDAPTHYGAIAITVTPVKRFRANLGYRMSAVDGATEFLNPRQVPGTLQSQYQTPFVGVAWTVAPQWIWKADWNYYGYGEGAPPGPTSLRNFHSNLYTLSVRYEF